MYNVQNKSGRPFVCTLKDGSTLRLAIDEIKQVEEDNITNLIRRHEQASKIIITKVKEQPVSRKK